VFSKVCESGKSVSVLVVTSLSAERTTAKPSPTGTVLPSVVVTTPSPVKATTVTSEDAGSVLLATMSVCPAFTGATVPRGVTITTEAFAKLSSLASRTKDPLFSVSLICGKGLPDGSSTPPSIVSPMINSLEDCSSIKRSSAKRSRTLPSLPATTIAPVGSTSLILLAPSTGISLMFTTTPPSEVARTALVVDSAAIAVQRTATRMESPAIAFTTVVMRASAAESTSFKAPKTFWRAIWEVGQLEEGAGAVFWGGPKRANSPAATMAAGVSGWSDPTDSNTARASPKEPWAFRRLASATSARGAA
jgi:hypothetical protein